MDITAEGIAAIIVSLTGLLTTLGGGAWAVFTRWQGRQDRKEAERAKAARRALAAKNREINALKRKLADCEARRGAAS